MKIHPRLGTGIVCVIYIVAFFVAIKILDIDFEKIKLFYYSSIVIIAFIASKFFEKKD